MHASIPGCPRSSFTMMLQCVIVNCLVSIDLTTTPKTGCFGGTRHAPHVSSSSRAERVTLTYCFTIFHLLRLSLIAHSCSAVLWKSASSTAISHTLPSNPAASLGPPNSSACSSKQESCVSHQARCVDNAHLCAPSYFERQHCTFTSLQIARDHDLSRETQLHIRSFMSAGSSVLLIDEHDPQDCPHDKSLCPHCQLASKPQANPTKQGGHIRGSSAGSIPTELEASSTTASMGRQHPTRQTSGESWWTCTQE